MQPKVTLFQHPWGFWIGCALLTSGVLSHVPMFMMGQHTHWQLVGMPMSLEMYIGMALIPVGLALSCYGLMPGRQHVHASMLHASAKYFHVADGVALNREHWKLVLVLIITLAIDVMKPATLGFVMPGMSAEYELPRSQASFLALCALTGTTVGSVVWGRIADRLGEGEKY